VITTCRRSRLVAWLPALAAPGPAVAQPAGAASQPADAAPAFTPEQIEQVAAPIALYPDPLLAQVLMASTYPLEIVQAARFVKDRKDLKGEPLHAALRDQNWDDSVKSLVAFPEVLALMDGKLDWTQKLGDAFLGQQKELLDAVQRLRARAQAQGTLKSTKEQTVSSEPAAGQEQAIVIEPADPQVIYVPSYNPTVVYGAWPYPAYPPYIMHRPRGEGGRRHRTLMIIMIIAVIAGLLASGVPLASGAVAQRRFGTVDEAVQALVNAVRARDGKAMLAIFGEEGKGLVWSGDEVADKRARGRFVTAYDEKHRLEAGGGKVVLVVERDDFPFPIVPDGPSWRWDTAAGKEELLSRSIGRNELNAIKVCLAYVDAQREYYARNPDRSGLLQYAQRFASSPGKQGGLYWPTKPGDTPSPLGAFVAQARDEGYRKRSARPEAYWGYYYRILTSQGKDAPGGAYDYLAHRRLIGGFALVAFPAQYGVSGVMTFMVSHDGTVYQKDLGPDTAAIARGMTQFNPDRTWRKV
jgi:hypothetical protein